MLLQKFLLFALALSIVYAGVDNIPEQEAQYMLHVGQEFADLFTNRNLPQFAVLTVNRAGLDNAFDPCRLSVSDVPLTAHQNYVARKRITASEPGGPRHSERQVLDLLQDLITRNSPVHSVHIYSVNSPCRGCALKISRVARAKPTVQFYVGYAQMFIPRNNPASVGQEILQFTREQFRNVRNIHFAQLDPSCLQSSRLGSRAWNLFSRIFQTRGSCSLTNLRWTDGTCVFPAGLCNLQPVSGYRATCGDCSGNDLWDIYGDRVSLEECASRCSNDHRCNAFMFYNGHRCYPKTMACRHPSLTNSLNVFYTLVTNGDAELNDYESLPGDCPGNDIWSLYRRSTRLEDCASLCSHSSLCKAFMFFDNRECYPKSQSCQCPSRTNPKNVFYRKSLCNLQPVNGYRATCGDCSGNDLWDIYGDRVSLEECARRCSNDQRCNAFMFYNGHRCYPKTTACRQPSLTNHLNVFYTPVTNKCFPY